MTDRSDHTNGMGTAAMPFPPPGEDILRQVLASMFADCGTELRPTDEDLPDAAPARELQDELQEILNNPLLPADIQFVAYLADTVITDAFRNFFGDLISSTQTDMARREVVSKLAGLFSELAIVLGRQDEEAEFDTVRLIRNYVADYLDIVRRLNEVWIAERDLRETERL